MLDIMKVPQFKMTIATPTTRFRIEMEKDISTSIEEEAIVTT